MMCATRVRRGWCRPARWVAAALVTSNTSAIAIAIAIANNSAGSLGIDQTAPPLKRDCDAASDIRTGVLVLKGAGWLASVTIGM